MYTLLCLERLPPQCGEYAVCPVVCGHVEPSEHLRGGDGLRVHAHLAVRRPKCSQGGHEGADARGLAAPRWTQGHDAVTHQLRLVQLQKKC